ncbi:MAG: chromosomal replication initiator protein DnaA [Actinomycetota bacterium]|jgi:chromosomal replication initiator protein
MSDQDVVAILWHSLVNKLNLDERMTPQLLGYINLVEPKGVLGETLYLEVPNEFTRGILQERIRPIMLDAMVDNAEFGGPTNFAVVVNPEIEAAFTQNLPLDEQTPADRVVPVSYTETYKDAPDSSRSAVASDDARLNPKYTFENFVSGGSNRMAHAAAFAVAEAPAKAYNPLFIYGDSGLGKTHLLHAVGHYALNLYPKIKVRYVSSEEFTNDFINSIQNNRTAQFQADYRDVDLLLIDDIQFMEGKDQTQEAFFHTFNTLHGHNKQVVITSDKPPKQLTGFEDRMLSRFEWGLLTDIQAPELETRIAILRKKAERDKFQIDDEILEYMAARVASNIRELEGTLIRVTAYAALNRQRIDMSLVQAILKDVVPLGQDNVIAPIDIINAVAAYYKFTADDLYGSSRVQAVALARQIAMYLCREQTNLSLPKIGQLFGGRDHTTVMYANKKVNDLMKERRYVYNQITEILARIKADQR